MSTGLWSNFPPVFKYISEYQHPTDEKCIENLNRFALSLLKGWFFGCKNIETDDLKTVNESSTIKSETGNGIAT